MTVRFFMSKATAGPSGRLGRATGTEILAKCASSAGVRNRRVVPYMESMMVLGASIQLSPLSGEYCVPAGKANCPDTMSAETSGASLRTGIVTVTDSLGNSVAVPLMRTSRVPPVRLETSKSSGAEVQVLPPSVEYSISAVVSAISLTLSTVMTGALPRERI